MAAADRAAPSIRPDRNDPLAGLLLPPVPDGCTLGDVGLGDIALALEQVHNEDRGALESLIDHLRQQPELTVARLDVRVRNNSGEWVWREAVASNLVAGAGLAGIHFQWREAARNRHVLGSACASDDRLQLIADVSDDIIGVASGDRRTLYASPALARITGYTLEEIQASDFSGRVHPADIALVELARNLNLRGQGTRIEYRYRCKSGEYVWLDCQATPVLGASGSVERIVLTTREITLRKAAERELRRLEASWRSLVQCAPDIVELLDASGTVLFANRARPGRELAEVVGWPLTRDLSPPAYESLLQALHGARTSGETADVEWQWSRPGHKSIWYWSRITPLATADQSERLVMVSRDATELRRQSQHREGLPAAVRSTAQQVAAQLVTSLDRLATVNVVLPMGSKAGAALEQAQTSIRSAAALAGRLAALAVPAAPTEALAARPAAHERASTRPAHVLLVDDDESVRASLLALLQARGARVLAAADGREAIDLFEARSEEIDAVVLDQNMPAISGTSVLRELRAIRSDVKVVISSGDAVEPWETQVDECNRLAFAHKALGPQELIAQLERLLQRKL